MACGAAAPLSRARLATPRHRVDRAHTRADAPPVPAVIAHGRLEGAGARLHTCAERPDPVGGQSSAHPAVWVCMGAAAMARGCWVQSRRSHHFVRRGPRGGWSSTQSDAGRAAAARQPGRQHRARSGTRAQLPLQAAPTATCALRHRGSNTTRRRASIDVPEVPLMMVIDCLHAQQASSARIGSDCYAHAALRILAQLQLRTLGELTMCTLHLERELCARLLCSREAAASLRRPSVGLSASARGAKSASSRIHLAPFYAPPTQCGN